MGTGLAVFAFLNRSAAILTLVGTLFNLIAPPAFDEPLVNADSLVELAEGLNAETEVSEAVVHGDGKGLRGETIDADVDKWATPGPLKEGRPLLIGILRASDAGLRNSDGRLCFAGLMLAYLIVNNVFQQSSFLMTYLTLLVRSLSRLGLGGPISLRSPLDFPLSLKLPAPLPKDDPEPDDSHVPQPRPNESASFEESWADGIATGLPSLTDSDLEGLDWSCPEPLEPL